MKMTYRMQVGNNKEIEISLTAEPGEHAEPVAYFKHLVDVVALENNGEAPQQTKRGARKHRFYVGDKLTYRGKPGVWEVMQVFLEANRDWDILIKRDHDGHSMRVADSDPALDKIEPSDVKSPFKFQVGDKVRHCDWHGVWEVRHATNAYSLARPEESHSTCFVCEETLTLATQQEIHEYNRLYITGK